MVVAYLKAIVKQTRNASEQEETRLTAAQVGLRRLLKRGRLTPDAVLGCPELLSLTPTSGGESAHPSAALLVERAIARAIDQIEHRDAARLLFGLSSSMADRSLRDRRKAAAKQVHVTPESFRVRRESRLIDELAHALLIELADPTSIESELSEAQQARRPIAEIVRDIGRNSMLTVGLWEADTTSHLGRVIQQLKSTRGGERRIEDGYQYVGSLPAHMWRMATADPSYRTLNHGITTFPKRWSNLQSAVDRPFTYVSIGPGTGEKDGMVLAHLQSLARSSSHRIGYIPVDISADLLRMSLDVSMRGIDDRVVEVLPIELDIANPYTMESLKAILENLPADNGVLVAVLGNTLANFRDDRHILRQISSLLNPASDALLLELATTADTSQQSADLAESEYEGSLSFRNFVFAALAQYTDCTPTSGDIIHQASTVDGTLEIATYFHVENKLDMTFVDGDRITMAPGEKIRLYTSRKYTAKALRRLLYDFEVMAQADTLYSSPGGFGLTTMFLRPHFR